MKFPPPGSVVAFDFETAMDDSRAPLLLAFAWRGKKGYETECYDIEKLDAELRAKIFDVFDKCKCVVAHNLLFDLKVLRRYGYDITRLEGRVHDTSIMVFVQNTEQLKALAANAHLVGEVKGDMEQSMLDREKFKEYNKQDALITIKLLYHFVPIIGRLDLWPAYSMEVEMVWVTLDMYDNGMFLDKELFGTIRKELEDEATALHTRTLELAGRPINLNSTPQLTKLIHDEWKVPHLATFTTGKGSPQLNANAVAYYAIHPDTPEHAKNFLNVLADYKKVTKLLGSYFSDKFLAFIHPDGRVRSDMNPLGTTTGRYSARDPGMQTIPARGKGARMRNVFRAQPGWKFVIGDESQLEYRILAHFSQDTAFIDSYKNNPDTDAHQVVADMLGLPGKEGRSQAKNMNFASAYLQGSTSLAVKMGIAQGEARAFLDNYFRKFPGVKTYQEFAQNYARATGTVKSLSGEIRRVDRMGDRVVGPVAVNSPIQSTAAAIMKLSMIKARKTFPKHWKCVLQVHDELIYEVPEDDAEKCVAMLKDVMENSVKLSVPLLADPHIGDNWTEAKGD